MSSTPVGCGIRGSTCSSCHAGTLRTLDDTLGADELTWSPDGRRIAYAGRGPQPDSPDAYDSAAG